MLFTVTKNKVELTEIEPVNQGEYKATVLEFEFVSAYAGLTKKAIITSNVSDKYLPGILIGYISQINVDSNNLTKSGLITPAVDFEHLEEVLVITELKQTVEEEQED